MPSVGFQEAAHLKLPLLEEAVGDAGGKAQGQAVVPGVGPRGAGFLGFCIKGWKLREVREVSAPHGVPHQISQPEAKEGAAQALSHRGRRSSCTPLSSRRLRWRQG